MAVAERVTPITIFSPVRRLWARWLALTWPLARRSRLVGRPLVRLGFINFAHWSLIDRVPARAGRRDSTRLRHPHIIFQSNFNGPTDLYIDAFSFVVPGRMWLLWRGAYRYPGARPTERFKTFIKKEQTPTDHYWCAYPEASSRMIVSALELRAATDEFARAAAALSPGEFAIAYRRFLGDVQRHL